MTKKCAKCEAVLPVEMLTCPACESNLFVDQPRSDPEKTASPGKAKESVSLMKWALAYVGLTLLVGFSTSMMAHILVRNGFRAAAEGMAMSPNFLVPLGTVLFFAFYSCRYLRPFVHAGSLFVAVSALGLGLDLLGSASPGYFLIAALNTFIYALVGTIIGLFLKSKKDPV